jgi:predicted enzyme related to lactoylglutathione lyase
MLKQTKTAVMKLAGLIVVTACCIGIIGVSSAAVRFEHMAINVDNPKAIADWYVKYVGLEILSASKKMIFVRDPGSHFMFELYKKPNANGSYSSMNHAATHVAFSTGDAQALSKKMVEGGAKILKTTTNPAGDTVINMKDPWGNKLQVIHRVKPKL